MTSCPHCAAHHPFIVDAHFQVTDKGIKRLGPCTASPEAAVSAPDLASAKIHEMATRKSAVDVLASLPMPVETADVPLPHNEIPEREPGEEG